MSTPVTHVEDKYKKERLPEFEVGDQVSVAVSIRETSTDAKGKASVKTRVQNFIGDVIGMQGQGIRRSFTVRRVVQGEGVERVFPFHSPLVQDVKILRKGDVRRAKLYDLRTKSGKAARIKERQTQRDGDAAPGDTPAATDSNDTNAES